MTSRSDFVLNRKPAALDGTDQVIIGAVDTAQFPQGVYVHTLDDVAASAPMLPLAAGARAQSAFVQRLTVGLPSVVTVMTDSTGDAATEWPTLLAQHKTFVDGVRTQLPNAGIVVVRQNPTGSTASTKARQDLQMVRLAELAAREGYSVIDAYAAFRARPSVDALMESASDVHPNVDGQRAWAAEAARTFGVAA